MKKLMILALMLIAVNVQAKNDSYNNEEEETGTYSGQLGDNQYTTDSTNNSNGKNDNIRRSNPNNPYREHGNIYSPDQIDNPYEHHGSRYSNL